MIIPIRCFTCGKLVADKWEEFIRRVRQGEPPDVVLTSLKIIRYCCRRMMLSHINLIDDILPFSQHT
nr:DNA-directed RNA polymerase subunit N [Candidatus Freyarchaeota archaeon]